MKVKSNQLILFVKNLDRQLPFWGLIPGSLVFAISLAPINPAYGIDLPSCGKWLSNLITPREVLDIYFYTIHRAEVINTALRSPSPPSRSLRHSIERLNRILDKLPAYEGYVYRWADMPQIEIDKYVPGAEIIESAFLSTSANEFHGSGWKSSTQFKILSKTGRKVSKFSSFSSEQEVLFKTGSQFKVVGVWYETVVKDPSKEYFFEVPEKIAHITLEEINTGPRPFEERLLTKQSTPKLPLQPLDELVGGSTGARWYRDADGVEWLLKKDKRQSELQTAAEIISSRIYRALGYTVADTALISLNGIRYTASRRLPDTGYESNLSQNTTDQFRILRFFAAYLKDWDRMKANNLDLGNKNFALFDFAGTLGARGRGKPKGGRFLSYSPQVGTFEATENLGVIYDSFKTGFLGVNHPWNRVNAEDAAQAVSRLQSLSNELIEEIVRSAQYSNLSDEKYMIYALKLRRDGLIKNLMARFGVPPLKY